MDIIGCGGRSVNHAKLLSEAFKALERSEQMKTTGFLTAAEIVKGLERLLELANMNDNCKHLLEEAKDYIESTRRD